jgi:hypothetical protein
VSWPWLQGYLNVINIQNLQKELNSAKKTTSPITFLLEQHRLTDIFFLKCWLIWLEKFFLRQDR